MFLLQLLAPAALCTDVITSSNCHCICIHVGRKGLATSKGADAALPLLIGTSGLPLTLGGTDVCKRQRVRAEYGSCLVAAADASHRSGQAELCGLTTTALAVVRSWLTDQNS